MPKTLVIIFAKALFVLLAIGGVCLGDTVRINEIMAFNGSTIADEDGDFEDWIELHNYGAAAVDLSGWGLSDDPAEPMRWIFPDRTTIGAGQYLLVWASGKDRPGGFVVSDPSQIEGLVLWMRASSLGVGDGEKVTAWQDESGRGNDATQSSSSQRPSLVGHALNGLPAVAFDRSANQQLQLPTEGFDGLDDFTDFSMFQVIRWTGGVTSGLWGGYRGINHSNLGSCLFEINATAGGRGQLRLRLPPGINLLAPQSVSLNNWHLVGATKNSQDGRARLRVDGQTRAEALGMVGETWLAAYERIPLGSSYDDGRTFGGEMAEFILYNRDLPADELLALEEYVARRYGLSTTSGVSPPHTNFRISAAGESLQLTQPDGVTIADAVPAVQLPRDVAYGRDHDFPENWAYFYSPTPGEANRTVGFATPLAPISFSAPSGSYSSAFPLDLSHSDPEVMILFTTDGSEPHYDALDGTPYVYMNSYTSGPLIDGSTQTHIYKSPITIHDRSSAPNRISNISSTDQFNPNFLPGSPINKGTVVRARPYRAGVHGEGSAATYFVSDPGAFRFSLPIVSLSFTESDFFDFTDGIYVAGVDRVTNSGGRICNFGNYNRRGRPAERSGHFHYWEGGQLVVDQPVGIRIQGNCSRMRAFKSLRLYARDNFNQESTFSHSFFRDPAPGVLFQDDVGFNRLILRAPNFNDTVFSRLYQPVYEGVSGRLQPAIKFFNGEFWGLCLVRDRFDPYHLKHHYGLDPDNITIVAIRYPWEVAADAPGAGNRRYDISSGIPSDMDDYIAMRSFVTNEDMGNPSRFAEAETLLCMDSFIDHLILKIFAADDHYAPEFIFWRARVPENDNFGDGRWRVFVKDFDSTLRVDLGNLIERLALGTHPRPFGYEMFASLLENPDFRHRFINRFADLLNTHFRSERFSQIIHESFDEVAPYWGEVTARWNNVDLSNPYNAFTSTKRDELLVYSQEQPRRQRQHIREFFNLSGQERLTIRLGSPGQGSILLNRIHLDGETESFPWSGIYFQGVPVRLEAQAKPGHRFVHWQVTPRGSSPAILGTEAIMLSLHTATNVEAVFEPVPLTAWPIALHTWDFEDAGALLAPSFTIGNGTLTVAPGPHPEWEAIPNTGGDFESQHLRINYPLGTTLTFALPTTGYEEIKLDFLTRRSGQGAGLMSVEYTTDGLWWREMDDDPLVVGSAGPQAHRFTFSESSDVTDNPLFAVRFTFAQGVGGTAGNNRFDQVVATGVALPGTNLPPVADGEVVPSVSRVTAGGAALVVSLHDWFIDPEGDALSYSADSSAPAVATVDISGPTLTVIPLAAGETTVTVRASDSLGGRGEATFILLVYPQPFTLSQGAFLFAEWDALAPAGTYPANMLFVQSEGSDPPLTTPLNRAYHIPPADAAFAIDVEEPYNATSRSRINGLGENGIAFINTGRGRDCGAAVVALDTTGVDHIRVSFTAGTLLANERVYAIRLQSRIGVEGAWEDVPNGDAENIEYVRNATSGHTENIGPVRLPEGLENQPLVFLRWFYYYQSGSGARPQLRLDDIVVVAGEAPSATELALSPLPYRWAQSGQPLPPLEVRAVSAEGATDIDFNHSVTISLFGDGTLSGHLTASAVNGVATFHDLVVTGPDGSFQLIATAPGLTDAGTGTIQLSTIPVLGPTSTADWTENRNWTSGLYPNGVGSSARVSAALEADRNVDLHHPVTIGNLIIDNADSPHRNRLRDRATGNILTFAAAEGPSLLRILGRATGWVELNNVAGTILANDLRIEVENTAGDSEFGALRLRENWSGPGGLIKAGPGMASLTGEGKMFTGAVVIEQGVLAVSHPASPIHASSLSVAPGGQLRLTSASSEIEPVRVYNWGGPLSLAGGGRSGVPDGEGLGLLGALRYEPGSYDNTAEIASDVTLVELAGVHVAGQNTLILSGGLNGSGTLHKSGGGVLALTQTPANLSGPIVLERGLLLLNGTDLSANTTTLTVMENAGLGGHGQWGGRLKFDEGSTLFFSFANGPPTSAALRAATLEVVGRLTVEVSLPEGLSGAYRLPLIEADTMAIALGVGAEDFSVFGADGFAIRHLEVGPTGLTLLLANTAFDLWRAQNFDPAALQNPALSDPQAEPLGDGASNLLKYALGLTPFETVTPARYDSGRTTDNQLFLRFYRDPSKTDITYLVESSLDLVAWDSVLFDSSTEPLVPGGGGSYEVSIAIDGEARRFLRLRITSP
jgi:hypothetical protein